MEPMAVSVNVKDFELVDNHTCIMVVKYDDDTVHELTGRVNVNHIGKWTIAGYDPHGKMTMVDVQVPAR